MSELVALNEQHTAALARIFKLLGDEGRLKLVLACVDEPKPVCCLSDVAEMSQSLTSHHLRSLRDARILRATRRGRQVFYELDDDHIRCVLQDMAVHVYEHDHCCEHESNELDAKVCDENCSGS